MSRHVCTWLTGVAAAVTAVVGCVPVFVEPPIETSFAFTNLSTRFYAALQIRAADTPEADYFSTALLPPGATQRQRFLDALADGCPAALDLRVLLYRRSDESLPLGMGDEAVDPAPVFAGEVLAVPACNAATVETYTIVNWDAPEGTARVKLAQETPIDDAIRGLGLFPNRDAAWEFAGVAAELAGVLPPQAAAAEPIAGRVLSRDGAALEGITVLLRTRFRVRLDDADPANDPDAGFGAAIATTETDGDGTFAFARPGGAYRVEFVSGGFAFRPALVDVETPNDAITIIAEPAP
ncbi:MAG: carboxypeptidase regulatory-like domain-containing protein [Planctomycetes bacterium]|nr:carboxypeptidase regulatory-like domain-containing protein [Planctomycetota bacterium]